jgi:hypothetical protein
MNFDPSMMSFSDAATFEAPALHPNTMQDMQPQKKRARTLREKDWEPCKPRITELLSTQKPQLAEVKLLIEKEFNFTAEYVEHSTISSHICANQLLRDRQWKSRLKQWGLERNIKPKEMKAIVRNRQQRRLVETDKRDLKFRVRGHEVEPQKIERWMKRYDVMESALYAPSPAACKLLCVDCTVYRVLMMSSYPFSCQLRDPVGNRVTRPIRSAFSWKHARRRHEYG